jgi:hypothetical protein
VIATGALTRDRRLGSLAILAGAAFALAVQAAAPVGIALYDGVPLQEPYRFLHPSGDQAGSPSSVSKTIPVVGGVSPAFAAATTENPTQAQLVAQKGAFVLSPAAVSLQVSITPVEPPAAPAGGPIQGNVYRFSVTDQAGTALAINACTGCVSLSMRAPDGIGDATIERFAGGAWEDVLTVPIPITNMFQTNPIVLGDLAVIGSVVPADNQFDLGQALPFILAGGAVVALIAGIAFLFFFVKPGGGNAPPLSEEPLRRVPSRQKGPSKRSADGPKRPKSGRSGR